MPSASWNKALASGEISSRSRPGSTPKSPWSRSRSRSSATAATPSSMRCGHLRGEVIPKTIGQFPARRLRRRDDRWVNDFDRRDEEPHAARVRVRPRPRVPADAGDVPVDRDPRKAVLLNLLSVGAAYGVLVAVFQNRWGEGILGFHSNGAIAPWLPLFLFVILFGLSMDYHVFILSRDQGTGRQRHGNDEAVATASSDRVDRHQCSGRHGRGVRDLRHAASVDFKQFGLGLASPS